MSDLGNKEIFSKNLRYYMAINNKTRNDICKDLNFKYTTFTSWYNGDFYPRIDKIEMLANYFNIEKSDLIERHNNTASEFDKQYSDKKNLILYTVTDSAMLPLLDIDDIAHVIPQDTYKSKSTILFKLDGKETIRKILEYETYIELHAMNPYFPTITIQKKDLKKRNFIVIGKVIKAENTSAFKI